MKNRYLKNARIAEKKVRELISLFCQDLTATQIANITGVSRITVNAYLKLIRTQIAQFCEEQNPYYHSNGLFPVIMNKQILLAGDHYSRPNENHFYGIFKTEQGIFTQNIIDIDAVALNNWLKGKMHGYSAFVEENQLNLFDAIADFERTKLFRLSNSLLQKGKSRIDEIDLFWGVMKSRIIKFRGLNTSTTYLHVKESEFRYNYRNTDLFTLLHTLIRQRPLHYMRQEVA